eukprot:scaffold63862_cov78-Phaeocystis_antarctica.AAC.1
MCRASLDCLDRLLSPGYGVGLVFNPQLRRPSFPTTCTRNFSESFPRDHPVFQNALEVQLEAAAGGRFEGLLGVVAEVVVPQPATGRCRWERARAQATHPWAKEGVAAVHA